jgi:VCBS repeat-containing protein
LNKKIILAIALLAVMVASMVTIPFAYADSAGPRSGTTFAGNVPIASGDFNWVNPSNAASSDNSYATATVTSSLDISNYLRATGFGFTIPTTAIIQGIEVQIERSEANTQTATIFDNVVSLVKNNVVTGQDKGTSTAWPTTDAIATYGGSSDLWGTTWTPADINNANFGVVLSVGRTSGGNEIARVDHMTITVTYFVPSAQGPQSSSTAAGNIAITSGDANWNNAGNITTSNNLYADVTIQNDADISNYLRATGFGFTIPSTATITGIEAKIERSEGGLGNAEIQDNVVSLVKNNVVTGSNKAVTGTNWPTTDTTATYGSSSDLWGTTWTPADINNANFGVVLSVQSNSNTDESARVDHITMTVYYTLPPNTTPTANAQSLNTDEDTSLPITLTGNANDVGQTLTFEIVTNPSHGTLSGFNSATGAVTYNPAADYNGPDSFAFRVNDGFENSSAATVSITVSAVNDAPVASNQSVSTNEDTALPIVLAATDIDGDLLSYEVVDSPAHGTLSGTAPNLTYTPSANYHGSDSFTFKANDGTVDSNTALVSIIVDSVNDAPTADGQSLTTDEDTAATVTLTGSDVEDGATVTYAVTSGPSHGALSGTAPNLTYTPDSNYNGPDEFKFKVTDTESLDSSEAIVSIAVNAVNDAPALAAIGPQTIGELSELAFNASATDSDLADTLTYSMSGEPTGASIDSSTGAFSWTPTEAQGPGSYTFDVIVSDGNGGTDSENVTVTVNEVNLAPSLTNPGSQSVPEGSPVSIQLLAADGDVPANTLTYAATGLPPWAAIDENTGQITGTPGEADDGTSSVTVTVSDGSVNDSQTFDITVTEVNSAPTASDGAVTTSEDTPANVTLVASDTDIPSNTLTYNVTNPSHGTLSGTAPNLTYTPDANYNGPDSFTFKVNDGQADSNDATVTITIDAVNDAPVADDQNVSSDEDAAKSITLTASDVDGDGLTFSVVDGPSHGVLSGTAPNLTYTPDANYNGTDSFTFKANDGAADSNIATVSITVNAVNDAPTADGQNVATNEDTPTGITLAGSDVEDGTAVTFTVTSGPSHGTLAGTAPNLTYTPDTNYNGPDSFAFTVTDSELLDSAEATVSITVNGVNDAPVASDASATTNEDTPTAAIVLPATDSDGDLLTYEIVSGPSNGVLSGTGDSRIYSPNADFSGSDSFTFKANDGTLDSNTATISITVNAVNDVPLANSQSVSTDEDTPVAITLTGNDTEDGALVNYAVTSSPSHGTLNGTAPNLTYTPDAGYNGPDEFKFKVTDSENADSAEATIAVTVSPVNDAPVLAAIDPQTVNELSELAFNASATDSDMADTLAYSLSGEPAGSSMNSTTGAFSWTPAEAQGPGSYTFDVVVSDGNGGTDSKSVTVTVNEVNSAPVANNNDPVITAEDTPVPITLSATDSDQPANTLTYEIVLGPFDGVLSGTAPNLTYAPSSDFTGEDSFTFKVSDGQADSNEVIVYITVTPANDPPSLAQPADQSVPELALASITMSASDSDVPANTLTFGATGLPSWAAINATTGEITGTPGESDDGTSSITVTVSDGNGGTDSKTFSLTVTEVNSAPTASDGLASTGEGTPVGVTLVASDADLPADTLTYSVVDSPSHGTLSGTAPNLTYTPSANYTGPDSFTFKANDGTLDSNIAAISLAVADTTAPTTTAAPAGGTFVGPQSISLTASEPATIYYTTNGTAPTTSSPVYSSPVSITSTTTLKFFAKDAAGNQESVKTEVYTITAADAVKPTVHISVPANGATINGPTSGVTVNISGTSSDNAGGSGIHIVEMRTETSGYSPVTTADGYANWTKSITFKTAGAHQLVARATDSAGNMQWHVININIGMTIDVTRPVVTVTIPVEGSSLSGPSSGVTVNLQGTSSDNFAVQIVEVRTDTSGYSTAATSDGYAHWTKSVVFKTAGAHQLVARATDSAGNMQWHVVNVNIVFTS